MAFIPKTTDYTVSPYTGLTRQSWIEAGIYLLEGIFRNIKSYDDPVVMPRTETEITYPHKDVTEEKRIIEEKQERFEGLARTFFIAAPLIRNHPELEICGYRIKDYYKHQVLQACTKTSPGFIGDREELQEITQHKNPFGVYQQTVETGALVVCLWITRKEIWEAYTKEERDVIAALISSFAHSDTVTQNWRFFNMLDMAFLHMEGYPVRKDIMLEHAQALLEFYAGDGWYRDGTHFDYYSCWAFNLYAPLWNLWYGYENEPYIAGRFEEHSNRLMKTYGDFFDRDGHMNMWGRSGIYRNAATGAFCGNMLLRNSMGEPGLGRRISSGALLQFLTREDFLSDGVPTLGFYGQFTPMVQGYSCVNSPFWFGKAFLCLVLPENHPFWTARESNGTWERLGAEETKVTVLNGPGLCFSNHQANGETILRTGKVRQIKNAMNGLWSYARLSYDTKFPWEATPGSYGNESAALTKDMEAQQYVLKDLTSGEPNRANVIQWCGERDGVLYRKQFFGYVMETARHWLQSVNLADFTVPYGIVRADKIKLFRRPVRLTLGAYGFPDNGTEITEKRRGNAKAIIVKGRDFTGKEKQLAMTVYDGWDEIGYTRSIGTNADSRKSIIIYAAAEKKVQYGGYEPYIMISQVITKGSLEDFREEELFPIENIEYMDEAGSGVIGPVKITLKNGIMKVIDFEGIEGNMSV